MAGSTSELHQHNNMGEDINLQIIQELSQGDIGTKNGEIMDKRSASHIFRVGGGGASNWAAGCKTGTMALSYHRSYPTCTTSTSQSTTAERHIYI